MKYLIDTAEEYGLKDITEQALGNKNVHGVLIDIHPFWYYCWYLNLNKVDDRFLFDEFEYYYYFFKRYNAFPPVSIFRTPYSMTISNMDISWRPPKWDDFTNKSNLLVKILLRPGSKPAELKYQGPLTIIQEYRSVPQLSASPKSMIRPLQGGISIGHASDPPGTLGGILYDPHTSNRYGLTCGHVIADTGYDVDQPSQLDNSSHGRIGKSIFSHSPFPNGGVLCNAYNTGALNKMDLALIELDSSVSSNHSVLNIGNINGNTPGNLLHPNLAVEFNGRSSDYKSVALGGIGVIQEVIDAQGQTCCFSELIEVKEPSMTNLILNRPVKGGDSGAWLVTQGASGNEWCAMIVAEDRQTGYAVMSETIISFLSNKGYNLKCY